jgi:hypothetical protein
MPALATLLFAVIARGALAAAVPGYHAAEADSVMRFPKVEGSNLEGKRFSLPGDFGGELNVVLVAFRREQQADVDTWVPFLKATAATRGALQVYEVPTLNRSYKLVRGFIDGGMARGIPEKATRETTITLYIDKTPFKRALAITKEDAIRVLLIARDGRVLWHVDGAYATEHGIALAAAIDAALQGPATLSEAR